MRPAVVAAALALLVAGCQPSPPLTFDHGSGERIRSTVTPVPAAERRHLEVGEYVLRLGRDHATPLVVRMALVADHGQWPPTVSGYAAHESPGGRPQRYRIVGYAHREPAADAATVFVLTAVYSPGGAGDRPDELGLRATLWMRVDEATGRVVVGLPAIRAASR